MREGLEVHARPLLFTIGASLNSVPMNIYPSLHPKPDFDAFYCAYIKDDAAKEPITTGESIPAIIAKAAEKTGRPRGDFEVKRSAASDTRSSSSSFFKAANRVR
jgi:hypothetical protein